VPESTKRVYLVTPPENIVVSDALDGMSQRMVLNAQLKQLMASSSLGLLVRAIGNAFKLSRQTGDSPWALLRSGWRMYRAGDDSLGATLMSANAPMMIQEAVVHGRPDDGILPSGQVAGLIADLPSVEDLLNDIMSGADAALSRLQSVHLSENETRESAASASHPDQSNTG
jgi:NAD(P)H-dependent flavin oxidoreductase YrpB (nitropropane dioxygenase family)